MITGGGFAPICGSGGGGSGARACVPEIASPNESTPPINGIPSPGFTDQHTWPVLPAPSSATCYH